MKEEILREEIKNLLKRDVFLPYGLVQRIKHAINVMPVELLENVVGILQEASKKQDGMFEVLLKNDETLLFGMQKKLSKF